MLVRCIDGRSLSVDVAATATQRELRPVIARALGVGMGSRLLFEARTRDEDSVVGAERSVVVIPERPSTLHDWVESESGAATQEDIAQATKHLRREALPASSEAAVEVQTRIHDFMSTMLMGGPPRHARDQNSSSESDDEGVAARAAAPLPVPPVPADVLEQVTAMGFSENAARKALILRGNRAEPAMEWILEHMEDADLNEPITQAELRMAHERRNALRARMPVARPPPRQRIGPFRVDPDIAARLQEMGFGAEQVSEALRVSRNNEAAAVSYLVGELPRPGNAGGPPDPNGGGGGGDDDDGDGDEQARAMELMANPVLRALLLHPGVQDGLRNPRVLEAFRAIMVDPGSAPNYLADPEVGPVLLEVNRILQLAPGDDGPEGAPPLFAHGGDDDDHDDDDDDPDDDDAHHGDAGAAGDGARDGDD